METRHWVCECGEQFENNGVFMNHQAQVKKQGQLEGHSLRGLIGDESGEVLATSIKDAISKGLVDRVRDDEEGQRTTLPAHVYAETLELDGRIFVLYDLTRHYIPGYKKTKAEWIIDCITTYYEEHPTLGLEQFVKGIAAGEGLGGEVKPQIEKEDDGVKQQEAQTSDASGAAQPGQEQGAETPVAAAQ